MTERFDENIALEHLAPFVAYSKSLGDGIGEAETAQYLLVLACAILSDCKFDTRDTKTGEPVRERFDTAASIAINLTDQVVADLSREEAVRRAEVIENLTPYQQQILGYEKTE